MVHDHCVTSLALSISHDAASLTVRGTGNFDTRRGMVERELFRVLLGERTPPQRSKEQRGERGSELCPPRSATGAVGFTAFPARTDAIIT
jgi:hypothetical protein